MLLEDLMLTLNDRLKELLKVTTFGSDAQLSSIVELQKSLKKALSDFSEVPNGN